MKIKRSELTTLNMVAGKENKYQYIIDDGILKQWIGFGWIEIASASKEDYKKYPIIED